MHNEEHVIDKSKLWSYNEANYTEEFRKKIREERAKDTQATLERIAREKVDADQQQKVIGSAVNKYVRAKTANGEIVDAFIKKNLDAKISAARWALALAMGMTLLLKGFWVLWIIFIIIYNIKVKQWKKESVEYDMQRRKTK